MKFYKTKLRNSYRTYNLRQGNQTLEEQIKYSYEEQERYSWTKKYNIIEIYLDDKLVYKSIRL
jgi:hypothetical protein